MRINPIQQNQNCLNTNFKGTVTPEATRIIQNLARHEAKNYVLCLGKGIKADKNILLGVQKYWNAILKKLNEKASQMHSDTIVNIESRTNVLGDICPFNFIFKNQNLGVNLVQNIFIAEGFITSESLAGEKLRNDVENIKPEIIDKEILEAAIKNLECELKNDNLSTYSTKYPAIIKYQNQLKNVTKEEAKNNVTRLNKAIDDAKAQRAERDKEYLEAAIKELERELKNDNLSTYSTKYPAIIQYQNLLKNVTKEEAKNNVTRLNKAIDDAKARRAERIRIETIEQENLELLDEIFCADKYL